MTHARSSRVGTAIVTAASSGIGETLAAGFARGSQEIGKLPKLLIGSAAAMTDEG
jgi:NADP-dependent 3-hydroxy acid dehydrogenase YdfG